MKRTRTWLYGVLFAISILLFVAGGIAQESDEVRGMLDGPERHLMTGAELDRLQEITTPDEARRFEKLFWARRDPDLTTWRNEVREEFDLRVAAADQIFPQGSTRGAMTDRGRVFIVLGPFDAQYDRPRGTVTGDSRFTVDDDDTIRYTERPAIELWEYRLERFPGKDGEGEVMAIFVETQAGQKNFVLDREHRRNAMVIRLLGEAAEWYIAHPDLDQAPDLGLVRGSRSATAAELVWFDSTPPADSGVERVVETGIVSDFEQWVWAHIEAPDEVPAATRLIGRLVDPDGNSLGSFSTPAVATAGGGYEIAVAVDPGRWTVEMALLNDGGPIAVIRETLEVQPLPRSGSLFSPLYWGVEGSLQPEAYLGDAYRVGAWQIQPRPSKTLTTEETLIFACSLIRPEIEEGTEPSVLTSMTLAKDGKTFYRGEPRPAAVAQVTPQIWMFGGRLGLDRLPGPGAYALEMEASQTSDGSRQVMRFEFTVVGSSS